MMLHIDIKNWRIIEHAQLEVGPGPTLLLGGNGAGKTAARIGISFVLAPAGKRVSPYAEVLGEGAPQVVRRGAKRATIFVAGPDGSVKRTWPKPSEPTIEGRPPASDAVVAGHIDPLAMRDGEWIDWLLCLAGQDEADDKAITAALVAEGIDQHPASVWAVRVGKDGWDAAAAAADEARLNAQRQWKDATGKTWRPTEATSWEPEGWEETRSAEELATALATAGARAEQTIAASGAAQQRATELREQAAAAPRLRDALAKAKDTWEQLERTAREQAQALVPSDDGAYVITCPGCKKVTRYAPNPAARKADLEARGAQVRYTDLGVQLRRAEKAESTLAEVAPPAPGATTPDDSAAQDRAAAARVEVTRLRDLLETRQRIDKAHALGAKAAALAQTTALLKPDGLRARTLDTFADEIQADFDQWSDLLWGGKVTLSLTKPGLKYRLWYDDGRYSGPAHRLTYGLDDPSGHLGRARIILQMLGWSRLGGDLVCVEVTSIDEPGQRGLLTLFDQLNVPALVTIKSDHPDTWAASIKGPVHRVYVLEDGRSRLVASKGD